MAKVRFTLLLVLDQIYRVYAIAQMIELCVAECVSICGEKTHVCPKHKVQLDFLLLFRQRHLSVKISLFLQPSNG